MLILVSLMKNWQIKFIALLEKNALTVLKIKMMKGNKIVRLSVKMDDNVANRATINDKGLFVSNITDCGAF